MKKLLLPTLLLAGLGTTLALCNPSGGAQPLPDSTAPADTSAPGDQPDRPTSATSDNQTAGRREVPIGRKVAPRTNSYGDQLQGVHGHVQDQRGQRLGGIRVVLFESASNDPIGRMLNLAKQVPMPPAAETETDLDGYFRLGLREPTSRRFELHLLAAGFAAERSREMRIHAGEWLDVGPITLAPGTMISGRVIIAGTDLPAPQAIVALESSNPFLDVGATDLPRGRNDRFAAVDAAGYYELRHAPRDGQLRLTVSAPGFARQFRNNIETSAGRHVRVDFELLAGKSIRGVLETPDQSLGRVQIQAWSQGAEPPHQGRRGPDGNFEVQGLHEGEYLLRVNAQGFRPVERQQVAAGDHDVRIKLNAHGKASVIVVAPGGRVLRSYRLSVRRYFPDNGSHIAAVRDVPVRSVRLPASQDRARVQGLGLGTYVFQVQADGYASTLSPAFTIDEEHHDAAVTLVMTRGATLHGLVEDLAGRPIAGAEVVTQPAGAVEQNPIWRMVAGLVPDRITRARARTDDNGQFTLTALAHASYQLSVTHPEHCRSIRSDLEVRADSETVLAPIVLVRGARLLGRTLVDGALASQVKVVLTATQPGANGVKSVDETALIRVEAVSNNQGLYRLPGRIPPGNYELRATRQLGNPTEADIFHQLTQMKNSMQPVTVHPGQEVVEAEIRIATGQ